MKPVLQDLANDLNGAARILKVDIDKNKKLAEKLEVQSVPTLMIYKEGKVIWRRSGAQTKAKLMKALTPHF